MKEAAAEGFVQSVEVEYGVGAAPGVGLQFGFCNRFGAVVNAATDRAAAAAGEAATGPAADGVGLQAGLLSKRGGAADGGGLQCSCETAEAHLG